MVDHRSEDVFLVQFTGVDHSLLRLHSIEQVLGRCPHRLIDGWEGRASWNWQSTDSFSRHTLMRFARSW